MILTVDSYAIKTNLKTAQNLATSIYYIKAMNLFIVKIQNGYFEKNLFKCSNLLHTKIIITNVTVF